jgi:hypothetical protein
MWTNYWEDWLLYHTVIFDGPNRRIYVGPNTSAVDIKIDVYSAWKEWLLIRDNAKYLPAIRTIGGDAIGGGIYAGDLYFLINNWQLVLDHTVTFTGALFSDDYSSPFTVDAGTSLAQSVVSNLILTHDSVNPNVTVNVTGSAASGSGLTTEQAAQLSTIYQLESESTASFAAIEYSQSLAQTDLSSLVSSQSIAMADLTTIITSQSLASQSLSIVNSTLEYNLSITQGNSSSLAYQSASLVTIEAGVAAGVAIGLTNSSSLAMQSSSLATISNNVDALLSAGGSLTPTQATMLLEMYNLLGLDPTRPLIVNPSYRIAGSEISQSIGTAGDTVTVTRLP